MKLSPFFKKVEIEAGYRAFYKFGDLKVTVTVEDNGVGVFIDSQSGHPLAQGEVINLFKPMMSLWEGKKFVEDLGDVDPCGLEDMGFVEVRRVQSVQT